MSKRLIDLTDSSGQMHNSGCPRLENITEACSCDAGSLARGLIARNVPEVTLDAGKVPDAYPIDGMRVDL